MRLVKNGAPRVARKTKSKKGPKASRPNAPAALGPKMSRGETCAHTGKEQQVREKGRGGSEGMEVMPRGTDEEAR